MTFDPQSAEFFSQAIDDDVVTAAFSHPHVADLYELGGDASRVHRVDALDERRGERILHPEEHTNFLHRLTGQQANRPTGSHRRIIPDSLTA